MIELINHARKAFVCVIPLLALLLGVQVAGQSSVVDMSNEADYVQSMVDGSFESVIAIEGNPSVDGCEANCQFTISVDGQDFIVWKDRSGQISSVRTPALADIIHKNFPILDVEIADCVDCVDLLDIGGIMFIRWVDSNGEKMWIGNNDLLETGIVLPIQQRSFFKSQFGLAIELDGDKCPNYSRMTSERIETTSEHIIRIRARTHDCQDQLVSDVISEYLVPKDDVGEVDINFKNSSS